MLIQMVSIYYWWHSTSPNCMSSSYRKKSASLTYPMATTWMVCARNNFFLILSSASYAIDPSNVAETWATLSSARHCFHFCAFFLVDFVSVFHQLSFFLSPYSPISFSISWYLSKLCDINIPLCLQISSDPPILFLVLFPHFLNWLLNL